MDLILLITCLIPLNSTIALFTACTSLDYIQGWIFLWIVRCTECDCHTFRWVHSAGPSWLPHPGVDVFLSLSRGLELSWSAFWVRSAWVRSCSCELLLLSNRSRPSRVTYVDFGLECVVILFSWFPPYSWKDILEVQHPCIKTRCLFYEHTRFRLDIRKNLFTMPVVLVLFYFDPSRFELSLKQKEGQCSRSRYGTSSQAALLRCVWFQ